MANCTPLRIAEIIQLSLNSALIIDENYVRQDCIFVCRKVLKRSKKYKVEPRNSPADEGGNKQAISI
jgi:hypothetical protein